MSDIYEYKKINVSLEPKKTIEAAANRWAEMGWRTVAVMEVSFSDSKSGFSDSILVERVKEDALTAEKRRQRDRLRGGVVEDD
jgi:hypothetical protein